jgi:hypothetical protein
VAWYAFKYLLSMPDTLPQGRRTRIHPKVLLQVHCSSSSAIMERSRAPIGGGLLGDSHPHVCTLIASIDLVHLPHQYALHFGNSSGPGVRPAPHYPFRRLLCIRDLTMSFPNVKAAWKKDFVYKTVGDLEISLTVWAPKQIKGTHPVIVQFHPVRLSTRSRCI